MLVDDPVPEEYIHPLFEVQYPPFAFTIIASGALRKAYDQAKTYDSINEKE
jgi:hypothetical protein